MSQISRFKTSGIDLTVASLATAIALIGTMRTLSNAIWMAPDSWAFWEGAVSILDEKGYTYFQNDQPIVLWPPLYSVYLAAWQLPFGVSGRTVIWSQVALAAVATAGWTWVAFRLISRTPLSSRWGLFTKGLCCCFLALLMVREFDAVRADNLKYALLPVLILQLDDLTEPEGLTTRLVLGIAFVCAILLNVHSSCIAFVVPAAAIVGFLPKTSRRSLMAAALILVASIGCWLLVRLLLGQVGSHTIGLNVARYSAVQYLVQLLGGSCFLLVRHPVVAAGTAALLLTVTCYCYDRGTTLSSVRQLVVIRVLFTGLASAILYGLFTTTKITDMLTGRFLVFIPAMLVPLAFTVVGASARKGTASIACCLLALLVGIPDTLSLLNGVQNTEAAASARAEQFAWATDCIKRASGENSWECSPDSVSRVPPPPR